MKKKIIFYSIFSLFFLVAPLSPCTIFNASRNGLVLVGNNEDMFSTETRIWFTPPSEEKYGVFYIGFTKYGKQGAMNDRGLFFDANALKYSRMNPHPEKPKFPKDKDPLEQIMETCATVEEVIELFSQYNLEGFDNFQAMFVDKSGDSAVIGADKNGELAITRKKTHFQVSTNFNLACPEFGAFSYPCPRYEIATRMLENMKELSVDFFRSILSAVHAEGQSPTVYSNICDLTNGEIYVYNFHNFEEVMKFNLEEELKKGAHSIELASLFRQKTNAQLRFEESQEKSLSSLLEKTIKKEGLKSAVKKFKKIREDFSLVPAQLAQLVFLLSIEGKIEDAIEISRLFCKEYPKKAEAHRTLGDLYARIGERKKAIDCYRKSLKIDKENKELKELLEKLEAK